jgi:arylformamidase
VQYVDLSHEIQDGLLSVRGLPGPRIGAFLSRADSRAHYAAGTEFQISRIDMVANTGTYLDTPFHRYDARMDLPDIPLERVVNVPAVVIDATNLTSRAIGQELFAGHDLSAKAVLVKTGWSRHWQTPQYFDNYPFLSRAAAEFIRAQRPALVGVDTPNIDDTDDGTRPAHSILLDADIFIVEHLCRLGDLPPQGFTFTAVPPPIRGLGTFSVRAYACRH